MKKFSFVYFDYIKTILLICIFLLFIHIIYFIVFTNEAFCMTPEQIQIIKYFDPDTYIRHELDGTPIYRSNRVEYYSCSRETYDLNHRYTYKSIPKIHEIDSQPIYEIDSQPNDRLDPVSHRHELQGYPVDKQTLNGKLRCDLQANHHLYDTVKNKLFMEAKNKQRQCGNELPVYHKNIIDLYSKSDSSIKHKTKKCFGGKILNWIDNKPSGMLSQEAIEERAKRHYRYVLDKETRYKELIKYQESIRQEKEIMARNYTRFGKRR